MLFTRHLISKFNQSWFGDVLSNTTDFDFIFEFRAQKRVKY
jgi:hypothetical protein